MRSAADSARPSVDTRTRAVGVTGAVEPDAFWTGEWRDALERHGDRAAADAERLGLAPLAIAVDDEVWTLRRGDRALEVIPGLRSPIVIALDRDAFSDLVQERRTALGLVIGARTTGDPAANEAFCAWDPVLRSVLDGRGVYRPGDVTVRASDGTPLDLHQQFRLGRQPADAAHFLAEAGFVLLTGVFSDAEMDAVDADLAAAVANARPTPCARCSTIPGFSRSVRSSATATGRATRSASTSPRSLQKVWSNGSDPWKGSRAFPGTRTVTAAVTPCTAPASRSACV